MKYFLSDNVKKINEHILRDYIFCDVYVTNYGNTFSDIHKSYTFNSKPYSYFSTPIYKKIDNKMYEDIFYCPVSVIHKTTEVHHFIGFMYLDECKDMCFSHVAVLSKNINQFLKYKLSV